MGKIGNIVYAVSVAAGFSILARGCLGMSQFSNALILVEDYNATNMYIELKRVADVDEDGELSAIERKLMYARLDEDRYGPGGGNWLWKDIEKNIEERIGNGGRMYWNPKDRARISHALALYKQDEVLKP